MADQSIAALAEELMARELARNPDQFETPPPTLQRGMTPKPVSPGWLHTLGGLADAASTYYFLKRGTGQETNPLVAGLGGQHPERTLAVALAGLGATKGIAALLRKASPGLADAFAANLGAEQLALAVANANGYDEGQPSGFRQYHTAMMRHAMRGQ